MKAPALRLFVALSLPEPVRDQLVAWRASAVGAADGLRPVASEDLHVTLCFLGSLPAGAAVDVLDACAVAATLPAARLALGAPLWLPRRSPRVLAVALRDADGALAAVQAALSRSLAGAGLYRPEGRPFLAHVTAARVRRGARVAPVDLIAPEPTAFAGQTVTVLRSHLERGGARYEPLGRVALGAGAA